MKKLLKVKRGLREIEVAIGACGRVQAAKLAVGLSYNLIEVQKPLRVSREKLPMTKALSKFRRERDLMAARIAERSVAEQVAAITALEERNAEALHDQEVWDQVNEEVGEMEFEVDLYRIPLTYVPGWFAGDLTDQEEINKANALGVMPTASIATLLEYGILYDPQVEDRDGNPVKKEEAPKGKP